MTGSLSGDVSFAVKGDPGAVLSRVGEMRARADTYETLATSLARVSTQGWTGRAADRFHERFEPEPERWHQAAVAFRTAAEALGTYADELHAAQQRAYECQALYNQGVEASRQAKAEYDTLIASAVVGSPPVFVDPGQGLRSEALSDFAALKDHLDAVAVRVAAVVRESCSQAPDTHTWAGAAIYHLGEFGLGALEATLGIAETFNAPKKAASLGSWKLTSGQLTTEEYVAQSLHIPLETAESLLEAAWNDPKGVAGAIVGSVLDLETWVDNPGKAIGRLTPDAILGAATGGMAGFAGRGKGILAKFADISPLKLTRGLKKLDGPSLSGNHHVPLFPKTFDNIDPSHRAPRPSHAGADAPSSSTHSPTQSHPGQYAGLSERLNSTTPTHTPDAPTHAHPSPESGAGKTASGHPSSSTPDAPISEHSARTAPQKSSLEPHTDKPVVEPDQRSTPEPVKELSSKPINEPDSPHSPSDKTVAEATQGKPVVEPQPESKAEASPGKPSPESAASQGEGKRAPELDVDKPAFASASKAEKADNSSIEPATEVETKPADLEGAEQKSFKNIKISEPDKPEATNTGEKDVKLVETEVNHQQAISEHKDISIDRDEHNFDTERLSPEKELIDDSFLESCDNDIIGSVEDLPPTKIENLAATNPHRAETLGHQTNCVHCVTAYELRERGSEVIASPLPRSMWSQLGRNPYDSLTQFVREDGTTRFFTHTSGIAETTRTVNGWPNGARGWVLVRWRVGGGHIFIVEKHADRVIYADPQEGVLLIYLILVK